MNHTNTVAAPLFVCCLLAAVLPPAHAQDDVSARKGNGRFAKAGLRVSYQSYYNAEIEAVIAAATKAGRIRGYSHAPAADHAFVKGLKGGENPLKPKPKAAVEKGETDALVFGKWWCWQVGTGENSAMNLVATWGVKNNPQIPVVVANALGVVDE